MLSFFSKPSVLFVSAATVIIIFTIVITATVQGVPEKPFSQVIIAGQVWVTDSWICTSDAVFTIDAVLIAYDEPNQLIIMQRDRRNPQRRI